MHIRTNYDKSKGSQHDICWGWMQLDVEELQGRSCRPMIAATNMRRLTNCWPFCNCNCPNRSQLWSWPSLRPARPLGCPSLYAKGIPADSQRSCIQRRLTAGRSNSLTSLGNQLLVLDHTQAHSERAAVSVLDFLLPTERTAGAAWIQAEGPMGQHNGRSKSNGSRPHIRGLFCLDYNVTISWWRRFGSVVGLNLQ